MHLSVKNLFARTSVLGLLAVALAAHAWAQTAADVDAVVQKAISSKNVPAAGVAVVRDGKVVLAKGYGSADIEGSIAANENTAFQIASVTKQFTAAGILLLVEESKIKLDDPLGKYLSDVPAKWSGITIRQLMNQVSGIPNYTAGGKLISGKNYARAEIIDIVKEVPVHFEPGARWEYSNTNYFLLGMVIEKVSGKAYPEYMHERIFKPLGMDATLINTSGLKIKNAAMGYDLKGEKWERANLDDPSQPFAAGAIVSTPVDMAKWAIAVSEGKLLKNTSWDEAFAPYKLTGGNPSNYGFGWEIGKIGETSYLAHSGGIAGFGSYHVRFPAENLSVVVLTNAAGRATGLAMDVAGVYLPKVAATLSAQKAAQEAARNAAPIADTELATTKFLRTVFEGMLKGEGDPPNFSTEFQKFLFPDRIKQLQGPLGGQVLKTFDLMAAETGDGGKRRQYRGTFESGMKIRVFFTVDPQGKISGTNVRPE
jgi:CubicO group peptidase (beta-lactamase class C family)